MQKYRTLNRIESSTLNLTMFRLLNMKPLLSNRILEIIAAGFTQSELSRAAGVTKGTSNQWIDGKIKSIKLEYAQGIQALTGFSANWIVTGKGDKKETATSVEQTPAPYHNQIFHSAAPYYKEIEEVIRLMEQTDDRGRIKALLAVEDTLTVHAAVNQRASSTAVDFLLDETLLKIIHSYNHATPGGKELIINATIGASKEENNAHHQKAG